MPNTSSISYHYNKATSLALKRVEKLARTILRNHPSLDEFVMGMGVWDFTKKDGSSICNCEGLPKYMDRLDSFIGIWDDELKLTGSPMRFTANSKKRTNW